MHKLLNGWKALPHHKQIASIFVLLLLLYSFYSSLVNVFVTPLIYHLQQDSRRES